LAGRKVEVEAKIPVSCDVFERLHAVLRENGWLLTGRRLEEDRYYLHPCRDSIALDEAIRLRFVDGRPESYTYKGPRTRGAHGKARLEITVNIAGGDPEGFLEALGFKPAIRVVKERIYYVRDDILVTLDNVKGLGCYVEIEVPDTGDGEELIARTAESLGLEGPFLTESYAELIARRPGGEAGQR